jgi:TPR repeat protein
MAISWVRQLFKRLPGVDSEKTRAKAERGDAEAQFGLGLRFANGGPAVLDYTKAAHWYLQAANQQHPLAQFNLGLMFAGGQGVAQDDAKSLMWMRLAASQGDAGAQHYLGTKHRRDSFEGLAKDALESNLEAYKWFHLAAAQGYRASDTARDGVAIRLTREQVAEGNHRASASLSASINPHQAGA